MNMSAQRKFLKFYVYSGLLDMMAGNIALTKKTIVFSGGEGSQINATNMESLVETVTNDTGGDIAVHSIINNTAVHRDGLRLRCTGSCIE